MVLCVAKLLSGSFHFALDTKKERTAIFDRVYKDTSHVLMRIENTMIFKTVTAIAIFAFIVDTEAENVWNGFVAKWSTNVTDGFYTLPECIKAAEYQGWTQLSGVGAPDDILPLCYFNDPRVVILFSKRTGRVIGIQIGFPVADAIRSGIPMDYSANPGLTIKTLNGGDYYTGTALFHQDEENDTRRLWLEVNGKFQEIPTKPELVTLETPYYSKRCLQWMGLHYYQINSTMDCTYIFPWDLLRVKNNIIGFAFRVPGAVTYAPERDWFEPLNITNFNFVVPDAPTCLLTLLNKYGIISLHIYLRKNPLEIVCPEGCTAAYSDEYSYQSDRYEHRSKRAAGPANIC